MQPLPVSIRQLDKNASETDIKAATTVVHDALLKDTFFNFLIGGHKELFFEMQLALVRAGLIGGQVYIAEDMSGATIGSTVWFGPGHELLDSEEQNNAGFNEFMENLAKKEPEMTSWWMDYFLPVYAEFTTKSLGSADYKLNAWHLQLIGVLPAHQRRGVGTALIKHMEGIIISSPDANKESKRMCLETETEAGLAFYKSCGFIEKGVMQIKSDEKMKDTVPMWCVAKELA